MKPFARPVLIAGVLYLNSLATINAAQAQIRADGTVSTEVTQSGNVFEITEGSKAGGNLFHSFQEFSLPTGNTAFFKNGADITNIISRVTGGSISSIDGLIQANGGANLILINPEGISFGPNAQLDIGGSFLGSTANSVKFSDGTEFSATNPQNPLLTIAVPIGLQMGPNGGAIRVEGQGHNFTVADPVFAPIIRENNPMGLSVNAGNTLALVGNGINLEGGVLTAEGGMFTAEGGRIELGSVAEGLVNLESLPKGWSFNYDSVSAFGNLQLRSRSLVDASSSSIGFTAGSIQLQGKNLSIAEGSLVLIQNQGFATAGNITLNASESLTVSGTNADGTFRTSVNNQTDPLSAGQGGDIDIITGQLVVDGGASIVATTFGLGSGGDIDVKASESIQMLGASPLTPRAVSSIASATLGTGDAGNTSVSTQRLTATGGGIIAASSLSAGSGGNLDVTATESIEIVGVEPNLLIPSGLAVTSFGSGQAGNLTVDTSQLTILDGGRVDASALASGESGSLTINASEFVEVKGTVPESINPSLIASSANQVDASLQEAFNLPPVPSGTSGNVTINTPQLKIDQGAQVTVRNDGLGDAGILQVNANSISLDNQGGISAATNGGKGGTIDLQVQDSLEMSGLSQISSDNFAGGDSGNLRIVTGQLQIDEGAFISATTFGSGQGADVTIQATEAIEITGTGFEQFKETFQQGAISGTLPASERGTGIFLGTSSSGASGHLSLETPSLLLNEGAVIFSPTFASGKGGNIFIEASESVELSGSALQAGTAPFSSGSGGKIEIETGNLILQDGATIINATFGDGTGGDVEISVLESVEIENTPPGALLQTGIYTNTAVGSGEGGDVRIDTSQLSIRKGVISSNTGALLPTGVIPIGGPGGNVIVNASESVELAGVQERDTRFASGIGTTSFSQSRAGNLTINTENLVVKEGADLSTAASNSGDGGTLTVNVSDSIELIGKTVRDETLGGLLATSGRDNLPELEATGNAGDINVRTQNLIVRDGARIDVQSLGSGTAGNVQVIADSIFLDKQGTISAAGISGEGGNINLETNSLLMRHNSQISATAGGTGNGGNITLAGTSPVDFVVLLEDSAISANAFQGRGGNIDIETQALFVCPNCEITASSELGVEGLVEIVWLQQNANLDVIDLPRDVAESKEVVALSCSATEGQEQSEFIITGRGGLPPRPTDPLSSENLVSFDASSSVSETPAAEENNAQLPTPAQGWYVDSDGILILTAQAPAAAPYSSGLKTPECYGN